MARQYTQVSTSAVGDPDFRTLSKDAQWLYWQLMFSPKIDLAGIVEWRPAKMAARASGTTRADIERISVELVERRYIVIDEDTEEVLVRSFIRHDGVLKGPKTAAGLRNAIADIGSDAIRRAVCMKVLRASREDPSLRGLPYVADAVEMGEEYERDTPSDTPSMGYCVTIPIPEPRTQNQEPRTASHDGPADARPAASVSAHAAAEARFEEFWDTYPRHVGLPKAKDAWAKAVRREDVDVILASLPRLIAAWSLHPSRFTPHPTTWLNRDGWNDDPVPPPSSGNSRLAGFAQLHAEQLAAAQAEDSGGSFF